MEDRDFLLIYFFRGIAGYFLHPSINKFNSQEGILGVNDGVCGDEFNRFQIKLERNIYLAHNKNNLMKRMRDVTYKKIMDI